MKRHFLRVSMMLLAASLSLTSCQDFWDDLFGVEDNPSTPETPAEQPESTEHEYVDLGLPSGLKWATCNIGAATPFESGNFYAWGETEPKTDYTASTYKFYADGNYTKYGTIDGKYRLESEDDVAQVLWGSEWRMPTYAELQELKENCTFTWVEEDGVGVVKATGPNGNFIYFPLPGNYTGSSIYFEGTVGSYWSSDLSYDSYAKDLDLEKNSQSLNGDTRYHGQSVRPVYGEAASDGVSVTVEIEKVSDITEVLKQLASDIAAKGMEEYVINIVSNGLTATSDDHTISVPKIEGSNINLNFVNALTTEVPLLVEAAETASATSTEALNILTITMPESKGLSIELNMPETAVTLAAASRTVGYDEVVATVATPFSKINKSVIVNSYIGDGIAIKDLQVKGGTILMKEGASAETFVYAPMDYKLILQGSEAGYAHVEFEDNAGTRSVPVCSVTIESGDGWVIAHSASYDFNNIKILKGNADYTPVRFNNVGCPIEKVTIEEGCTMKVVETGYICAQSIEGEGEGAEIVIQYWDANVSASDQTHASATLRFRGNEMKNLSISGEFTEQNQEKLAGIAKENIQCGIEGVPAKIENCTFKFDHIDFSTGEPSNDNPTASVPNPGVVKGCKFIASNGGYYDGSDIRINVPYQTSEVPSYTINFIDCTFWENTKNIDVWTSYSRQVYDEENNQYIMEDATYSDYDVTVTIKDCKVGESTMDSPSIIHPMTNTAMTIGTINHLSEINGTSYIWDENTPWDENMEYWKQVTQ